MNGAESLVQALLDGGVEVCFANPGTSEMHFVAALDEVPGMHCVLCLFEGVASGAADGYARMARKPAATLLHLGPGLGNALANIHNAKRGNVGMINLVGDHATYHLEHDAPLTSDIRGMATPTSDWVQTISTVDEIVPFASEALAHSNQNEIATLVLPADVSWSNDAPENRLSQSPPTKPAVAQETLQEIADLLRSGSNSLIYIDGIELSRERAVLLSKVSAATGARIATPALIKRVAHGENTPEIERLPYLAELAIESISMVENIIILGGSEPVSFFAYPNVPSVIAPPSCIVHQMANLSQDIDQCLNDLVDLLNCRAPDPTMHMPTAHTCPGGALTVPSAAISLTRHLPENAIVVDEAITASGEFFTHARGAKQHDWLSNTGGSIGWGLPGAVGAAIACPERKVVCVEGDGSAMYTNQALWTMVREQLDITIIIISNRRYGILEMEFARTGARGGVPGSNASKLLDISNPVLDFSTLAQSMGMRAAVATNAADFDHLCAEAFAYKGPFLIDAQID